ncbi:MAG: hypothetical protein M5U19_21795 [Microthrixaceae bacterium]|nr:hypothetical protein [Microthrixaceae bacterium]
MSPVAADSPESDTDADHDADEDPDTDAEPLAHVEVVDLVTDLVYAHTFKLCDQHGPLIETADGKLLDLSEMVTDKVFTHRVDTAEAQRRGLDIGFDLWALSGSTVTGGRARQHHGDPGLLPAALGQPCLGGPAGRRLPRGDQRGRCRGRVDQGSRPGTTARSGDPRIVPVGLRAALRGHRHTPSSDLLVAEMLLDEPSTFDTPTAPLSEYATNLGLEVRRSVVADDPAQWRILGTEHRLERLTDWFDPSTNLAAMEVVDIAERIALGEPLRGPQSRRGPRFRREPQARRGHRRDASCRRVAESPAGARSGERRVLRRPRGLPAAGRPRALPGARGRGRGTRGSRALRST